MSLVFMRARARLFCLSSDPQGVSQRLFSTSAAQRSHIGRRALIYPPEVTITHDPTPITAPRSPVDMKSTTLTIKGPLGEHSLPIRPFIKLTFSQTSSDDDDKGGGGGGGQGGSSSSQARTLTVGVRDTREKEQRQMWGTTRALIARYITGVTEGFRVQLRIVGVGYRAGLEEDGRLLTMRLGYAHPIDFVVPEGLRCAVPNPQSVVIEGTDWQKVKEFAARIRMKRPPEPYNLKGIFVGDETIKKKEGKKK